MAVDWSQFRPLGPQQDDQPQPTPRPVVDWAAFRPVEAQPVAEIPAGGPEMRATDTGYLVTARRDLGSAVDALTGANTPGLDRPLLSRLSDAGGYLADAILPDSFQRGSARGAADRGFALGADDQSAFQYAADQERLAARFAPSIEDEATTRAMSEAQSVGDWAAAVRGNPVGALGIIGESLGAQAPALAVTAASGGVGVPATFAQSFVGGRRNYIMDQMAEAGIDTSSPAEMAAFVENRPDEFNAMTRSAEERAAFVASLDAASAGLAGRLVQGTGLAPAVGRVASDLAVGSALGGVGEAGQQMLSNDERQITSIGDILTEMAAEGPGAVVEGAGATVRGVREGRSQAAQDVRAAQAAVNQADAADQLTGIGDILAPAPAAVAQPQQPAEPVAPAPAPAPAASRPAAPAEVAQRLDDRLAELDAQAEAAAAVDIPAFERELAAVQDQIQRLDSGVIPADPMAPRGPEVRAVLAQRAEQIAAQVEQARAGRSAGRQAERLRRQFSADITDGEFMQRAEREGLTAPAAAAPGNQPNPAVDSADGPTPSGVSPTAAVAPAAPASTRAATTINAEAPRPAAASVIAPEADAEAPISPQAASLAAEAPVPENRALANATTGTIGADGMATPSGGPVLTFAERDALVARGLTRRQVSQMPVEQARAMLSDQPATPMEATERTTSELVAESAPATEQEARDIGEFEAQQLGLRPAVEKTLGRVGARVQFIASTAGLPGRLRAVVEARQAAREAQGFRGMPSGLFDPDTRQVYIYTNAIKSPERAVWTALHEIAGHDGLRALLGKDLDSALDLAAQNPTVKAIADAIYAERKMQAEVSRGARGETAQRRIAIEEALAELAAAVRTGDYARIEARYKVPVGEGVRANVERSLTAFIVRLRKMFNDLLAGQGLPRYFSDEDVRALLENAWSAAQVEPRAGQRPVSAGTAPEAEATTAARAPTAPVNQGAASPIANFAVKEAEALRDWVAGLRGGDRPNNPVPLLRRSTRVLSGLVSSVTTQMRSYSRAYPESQAIKALARIVTDFTPGVGETAQQRTIIRDQELMIGRWRERSEKIFNDNGIKVGSAAQNKLLRDSILNPSAPAPANIRKAAEEFRTLYAQVRRMMVEAGIEVGEITDTGYLNRVWDKAVIESGKAEFLKDAAKYMADVEFKREVGDSARGIVYDSKKLAQFMLQAKAARTDPDVDAALGEIRKSLAEYRRSSNLDRVLEVERAVARVYDKVASRYGERRAAAWYHGMMTPDGAQAFAFAQTAGGRATKERVLSAEADNLLSKWLVKDVQELFDNYLVGAAGQISVAKGFGPNGEKLNALLRQMTDEGVPSEVVSDMNNLAQIAAGRMNFPSSNWFNNATSVLHAYTYIALLDKAVLSSLTEASAVAIRSGDIKDIFIPLKMAFDAITRNKSMADVEQLASRVGIVTSEAGTDVLMNNLGGEFALAKTPRKVLSKFFAAILLNKLTRSQRIYAVGAANAALREMADNIARGRDLPATKRFLNEHGIADHEGFSRWILSLPTRTPNMDALFDSDGRETLLGSQYMTAIQRFVDATIQNADPSTRPELASNPYLRAVYGITAFSYAFYENIIKRTVRNLWTTWKMDGAPRAAQEAFVRVMPAVLGVFAGQFITTLVRGMLLESARYEDMDDEEKLKEMATLAANRSFALGPLDYLVQAYGQIRFNRSVSDSVLGAGMNFVTKNVDAAVNLLSDRNSPNTTTAESRFGQALYSGIVQPALNAGLSSGPLASSIYKVAAAATIIVGGDLGRDPFASMFGEAPERSTPIDREYDEAMREFRQAEEQMRARIADLPVADWQSELNTIKAEYPGMFDDVEFVTYANTRQNRILGRAGQPQVTETGAPRLRATGAEGVSVFGDIEGRSVQGRRRTERMTQPGLADNVRAINRQINAIREMGDMTRQALYEIVREVTPDAPEPEGDRAAPATRDEIQAAISDLTTRRREAQRRVIDRLEDSDG